MKKIVIVLLTLTLLCVGACLLPACDDRIQVSVLQYAEHGSLDNCYDGIIQGLAERGYTEENTNVSRRNAKGSDSDNLTAARTIINSVPDVAVGIATPSAYQLASAARGKVPVVFTAVSEPTSSAADFSAFDNVTGSSDSLPIEQQLKMITEFFKAKDSSRTTPIKIAILYTKSEANSVAHIAKFETFETKYNVEIISHGVNDATEIPSAIDSLLNQNPDCFNNLTDNTVVQNLATLLERTKVKNVPVFGSEIEQVERGCIASCSLDYVELGRQTGHMIADILDGKKSASEIPFLYLTDGYTVDYNAQVMSAMGFTLPADYTDANAVTAQ